MEEIPLPIKSASFVEKTRLEAQRIIQGQDDRILVIVGPCSIHDTKAAKEYALLLRDYALNVSSHLLIIMRVYFEKPRTTVGWKGLINDPFLDGSFEINKGLRVARQLLVDINEMGLACGCEFLDTITPQFIGDLVSWGAIGARTTESQIHRELASGLSVPVGFKNGTDGNIGIAIDAIRAASSPHHFLSVTKQGLSAIVCTSGNESCHVILRGSTKGPNYSAEDIKETMKLTPRVMVDCSHGNSEKKHYNQIRVVKSLCDQMSGSKETSDGIMGVMIESHLNEGRQDFVTGGLSIDELKYGVSITDACINWKDTVDALNGLVKAVEARRNKL